MVEGEDKIKNLYKALVSDPDKEVSDKIKKYGIKSFKEKLMSDENAAGELAGYALKKKIVKDDTEFYTLIGALRPQDAPTKAQPAPPVPQPPAVSLAPPQRQSIEQQAAGQATGFVPPMVEQPEQPVFQPFVQFKNEAELQQTAKSPVFKDYSAASAVIADREKMDESNPLFAQADARGVNYVYDENGNGEPIGEYANKDIADAVRSQRSAAPSGLIMPFKDAETDFAKMSPEQQAQAIEGSTGSELAESKKPKPTLLQQGKQAISDIASSFNRSVFKAPSAIAKTVSELGTGAYNLMGGDAKVEQDYLYQIADKYDKWIDDSEFAKQFIGDKNVNSLAGDVGSGLGQIATMITAGGGSVAQGLKSAPSLLRGVAEKFLTPASGVAFSQVFSSEYDNMKAKGESDNTALKQALANAFVSAPLESIPLINLTERMNAINPSLTRKVINTLAQGFDEMTQERLQQAFSNVTNNQLAQLESSIVKWSEGLDRSGEAGGLTGLIIGAIGQARIKRTKTPEVSGPSGQPPTQLGGIKTEPANPNDPAFQAEQQTAESIKRNESFSKIENFLGANTDNLNLQSGKNGEGKSYVSLAKGLMGMPETSVQFNDAENKRQNGLDLALEIGKITQKEYYEKSKELEKSVLQRGLNEHKANQPANKIAIGDVITLPNGKNAVVNIIRPNGTIQVTPQVTVGVDSNGKPQTETEKTINIDLQGNVVKIDNGGNVIEQTSQTTYETVTPEELQAFRQGQIDPERAAAIADDVALIQSGQMDINSIDDPNYRLMVESAMGAGKQEQQGTAQNVSLENKVKETENKIKNKGLFLAEVDENGNRVVDKETGRQSQSVGEIISQSDDAPVPTSVREINGIEFVEFSNPRTGDVDVIVTGKNDGSYVGYYRLYDNGKPTNQWSSKFENPSRNKEDFKTMISGVQSMLPEGHEYTEKTSISTDGLRVWEQQLGRGYELQTDENGNIITNKVAINGDAIVNELGIDVDKGSFENISVRNNTDIKKVRQALLPYLQKLGLNESNIYFENGTAYIDLPVLKKKNANATPQSETIVADQAAQNMGTAVNQPLETGAAAVEVGESGRPVVEVEGDQVVEEEGVKPTEISEYGDFLLNELESLFTKKYPKENFDREGIVKGLKQNRGTNTGRMESDVMELIGSYIDPSIRVPAAQALKAQFNKLKEQAEGKAEAPKAGSLRDVELTMRRPEKNEVIFVPIDALLQKHAADQPSYDIQKEDNRIKGRVEKAKEFLKNYLKDQRAINPKTGERTNTKVSFEPSVIDIDANGKISFEDGRHRVLAAKEMGLTEVPIEVPKGKGKAVEQSLKEAPKPKVKEEVKVEETPSKQQRNRLVGLVQDHNKLPKNKLGTEGKALREKITEAAKAQGYTVKQEKGKIILLDDKGKKVNRSPVKAEPLIAATDSEIQVAKKLIDANLFDWNQDPFSDRVKTELDWATIRKGLEQFRNGDTESQAAKQLIAEANRIHKTGGARFIVANNIAGYDVSWEQYFGIQDQLADIDEKELTPEEIERGANEFDNLTDEQKQQIYEDYEAANKGTEGQDNDEKGVGGENAESTEKNSKESDNKVSLQNEKSEQRPQQGGDRGGRASGGTIKALEGAPSVRGINGPDPQLVAVAESYAKENGIDLKRQAEYVEVSEDRGKRIAQAYEDMKHDPENPKVKEAFQNLIKQTKAQYQALVDAGYKFWFIDDSPSSLDYASSPYNALRDMRENKQMGVYPTTAGYGSDVSELDVTDNPMLEKTDFMWPVGGLSGKMKPVLANDLFRAVHDAFGHGLEGAGFRARGEENAWQAHVRLFTGSAIGAITSETRGQNSWLNFGPNGESNRNAKVEDTIFADQKTGLMPEWTWTEGRAADMQSSPLTPFQTKDKEGQQARAELKERVGPAEYKRLENIAKNGEKILKDLQAKKVLKIDCP